MQSAWASGGDDASSPDMWEIREQLQRILSSEEFLAPERGRRFLEYVVEETLAGRADYLKAYTIAQEVFTRDASFDAQNDPVVRIEAGRIRRGLERYYLVAGHDDRIVITIPKGAYIPCFRYAAAAEMRPDPPETKDVSETEPEIQKPMIAADRRDAPPPPVWLWYAIGAAIALATFVAVVPPLSVLFFSSRGIQNITPVAAGVTVPKVLVEPFEEISKGGGSADVARGLTEEVIGELAKFKEIAVIAKQPPSRPDTRVEEPRFALQGGVRVDGNKLRLTTRLVRRSDGSVIWANNYDRDLRVQDMLEVEADVARRVATAVAQPYGLIFQADVPRLTESPPNDWDAYACTLSYYNYRIELNPQNHAEVQDCLKRTTARLPNYATSWALLSLTYLDEVRFQYRLDVPQSAQPLTLALETAKRAVELDPENARALQALMLANFFNGDVDAALKAGAAAYAINPNDTEVSGEYGFRLAFSGRWETGCELMSSAISRNPGPIGYYEVGMAMCAYIRGDYQAAELWARMADLKYNPMHHLVLLAILGAQGKVEEAGHEQEWLKSNAPALLVNIRREVAKRLQRPSDQELFLTSLKAAGVAITP
ncbi:MULTISPECIES: tetratricopeptide repeat protein [Rhizobium]|uniref:TolB-like protein/Tfp pilus assembly protein PilF n=1 Tax=Rhizobium paranaense TaxID=1650438 RepID=A0A7W9D2T7_9HYPH|nr:hypothetical protein [Rhizobium paranaense]MBB5575480.1 TolB-like protein/Tfp pilus assembly protein PilF [Rhizobium paranaense]